MKGEVKSEAKEINGFPKIPKERIYEVQTNLNRQCEPGRTRGANSLA
jgi:hypothetical protein